MKLAAEEKSFKKDSIGFVKSNAPSKWSILKIRFQELRKSYIKSNIES